MTSDDIDALARGLPEYRPGPARVEQVRTAVLASAPGVTQLRPASRRVAYALVAGVALAATVAAAGVLSRSHRDTEAPAPAVILDAGDRQLAPEPGAGIDAAVAESSPVEPAPAAIAPSPAPRTSPRDASRLAPRIATSDSRTVAPVPLRAPGEAEFRAGWAALETGKPEVAAASFAAARQAKGSVLAEDASFWEGIALARAGKAPRAVAALRRFVSAYPSSSRAGEAAAKLGWLLFESGDLDAAQTYFQSAVDDVVPKVQQSARAGLTAIERKRGRP